MKKKDTSQALYYYIKASEPAIKQIIQEYPDQMMVMVRALLGVINLGTENPQLVNKATLSQSIKKLADIPYRKDLASYHNAITQANFDYGKICLGFDERGLKPSHSNKDYDAPKAKQYLEKAIKWGHQDAQRLYKDYCEQVSRDPP